MLVVQLHGRQSGVRVLVGPQRPPNVYLAANRDGKKNAVIARPVRWLVIGYGALQLREAKGSDS